jgi:hypothetical protein
VPAADDVTGGRVALARLNQVERQLDRLEADLDRVDVKFDTITARLDGIGNRLTGIEQWRTDFQSTSRGIVESKHWLVGAVIAGLALLVSVVALLVH